MAGEQGGALLTWLITLIRRSLCTIPLETLLFKVSICSVSTAGGRCSSLTKSLAPIRVPNANPNDTRLECKAFSVLDHSSFWLVVRSICFDRYECSSNEIVCARVSFLIKINEAGANGLERFYYTDCSLVHKYTLHLPFNWRMISDYLVSNNTRVEVHFAVADLRPWILRWSRPFSFSSWWFQLY